MLKVGESDNYNAYIKINGELSELCRIYIQSVNNSLGIPLSIKFVEITGINLKTGKSITEKYIP